MFRGTASNDFMPTWMIISLEIGILLHMTRKGTTDFREDFFVHILALDTLSKATCTPMCTCKLQVQVQVEVYLANILSRFHHTGT